ncbi:MAG: glycosyltransferase family 2 protein [Bacteroidales bacterium]|nr:glycosyltransferase family 2 protein [Bacteroidales bacterium]
MHNFFDTYFSRYNVLEPHITENPDKDLKIVVVIPCYNEPDILKPLNALLKCSPTKYPVEIIVVVNAKENSSNEVLAQNRLTIKAINEFSKQFSTREKRFFCFEENNLPKKHAGVGFARKIGMDEAVRRFHSIENEDGVIVNFDADCTCHKNYLKEIENFFLKNKKAEGVSISFEHDIFDENFPKENREAIAKYELYMRYYIAAQRFAGFPYAFQTVGSAFAVRVKPYCLEGGMNRRQAGEDFYFLQKIIPRGEFFSLNTTKVFPSIRFSLRVPFGTGVSISQTANSDYNVYCFESFLVLKSFFLRGEIQTIMQEFLEKNGYFEALKEMKENSATEKTFLKRFFVWFDAFRLLKFLNFSHESYFKKKTVESQVVELLAAQNIQPHGSDAKTLLKQFRALKLDVYDC